MNLYNFIKSYASPIEEDPKNDIEIIKMFIKQNHLELQAIDMLSSIASNKLRSLEHQTKIALEYSFVDYYPQLRKQYDEETTHYLCTALKEYFILGDIRKGSLNWLKDNASELEMPKFYYLPFIKWLEANKDIHFKKGANNYESETKKENV